MAKPVFDPNLPFEAAPSGGKPKFDPSLPFEAAKPETKETKASTTIPQTIAEQFGNQITGKYLPQLQGAAGALLSNFDPNTKLNKELEAKGIKVVEAPRNYATIRDETSKRLKTEESENPLASTIGKLLGVAGTLPLTAGAGSALGIGKAATALGRTVQGAGAGAVAGGLQNPETQDVNDPLGLKARGMNALIGAATGGVLQGGTELLAKSGSKIGQALAGSKPGGSVYDNVGPSTGEAVLTKAQELAQSLGGKAGRATAAGVGGALGATVGGYGGAGAGAYAANKLLGNAAERLGAKAGLGAINSVASLASSTPALTAFARNNPMKFQVLANQILSPRVPQPAPGEGYAILNDSELVKAFKANPSLVEQVKDPNLKAAIMARVQ